MSAGSAPPRIRRLHSTRSNSATEVNGGYAGAPSLRSSALRFWRR